MGARKLTDEQWAEFAPTLSYVPQTAGPAALAEKVAAALEDLGPGARLLHYLSVPPQAATKVIETLREADLVRNSRIVMEKPFGEDLETAVALNARIHETFDEEQVFRIDHFLGKEAAQNILAFRFANGLFEPIWNRNFIDHIQIDVPEELGLDARAAFYEPTGAYKDMVVTHLFQVMAFVAMEPPTTLEPRSISEEKNKVFRSLEPILPEDVVRGQYTGYRDEPGVHPDSDTETFIALRARVDNWRWAGVPFYLRTGKRMAEGIRIISIAFKEAPKSMFPAGSGIGSQGPDHLTFDLADETKVSLSFYGKRPGPGMRLDKLSMQFSTQETGRSGDVMEAYERLILDAMRGDHTLFTTAEGIESLWERSTPLLDHPPAVKLYAPGVVGPELHSPAGHPPRVAAAVRAAVAGSAVTVRSAVAVVLRDRGDPGGEAARFGILPQRNHREPHLPCDVDDHEVGARVDHALQLVGSDGPERPDERSGDGRRSETPAPEQVGSAGVLGVSAADELAEGAEVDPAAVDDESREGAFVAAETGGVGPADAVPPALAAAPVVVPSGCSGGGGHGVVAQFDVRLAEVDVVLGPTDAVPPALHAAAVVIPAGFWSHPHALRVRH